MSDRARSNRRMEGMWTAMFSAMSVGGGSLVWAINNDPLRGAVTMTMIMGGYVVWRILLLGMARATDEDKIAELERRINELEAQLAEEYRVHLRRLSFLYNQVSADVRAGKGFPSFEELTNGWGRHGG